MIQEVDKVMLTSQGIEPKVGMELSNWYYAVKVVEVTDDKVKIDNNWPLAGKTLLFDVELIDFAN
jgi:FKBP-type peptidyl-prolyl cis-trans isomerase 2